MKTWFTSDHHFCHYNIIRYTGRPFISTQEMNEIMIQRWNETVGPDDLVYHLGDFCIGGKGMVEKYRKRLNGNIVLIKGNHDRSLTSMATCGFSPVVKDMTLELAPGITVLLNHYPYRPNGTDLAKMELELPSWKLKDMQNRPEDKGLWLIHGHVHNHWKIKGRMINVSVENWDYKPVSKEDILQIIQSDLYT